MLFFFTATMTSVFDESDARGGEEGMCGRIAGAMK